MYVRRSFDQFANLVLEGAVERIIVGTLYAEDPLGLYVVRGENVVLLGDIDASHDPPAILQKVFNRLQASGQVLNLCMELAIEFSYVADLLCR